MKLVLASGTFPIVLSLVMHGNHSPGVTVCAEATLNQLL